MIAESVLNFFSCHYSLNNGVKQLFTQHLHCFRYYKLSRHDLKSTGGLFSFLATRRLVAIINNTFTIQTSKFMTNQLLPLNQIVTNILHRQAVPRNLGKTCKMFKITPDVIFLFGIKTHFEVARQLAFGMSCDSSDDTKKNQNMANIRRKTPQENSERNVRTQ